MSEKKRGRPQLQENELSRDQRRVWVKQRDWARLQECYQLVFDDASKKVKDDSGKLSSDAISEILDLFVQLAEEKRGDSRCGTKIPNSV